MDCMDGMKEFPDKYFDLAIVDPPYGINIGDEVGGGEPIRYHSAEEATSNSNRRLNAVRKQVRVGGDSLSHPKSIRRLMTATHQMPITSQN